MARRSGWYRPTGGGVMYGPLPDGAVEVPEPGSAPAPVIPVEGLDRLSKAALVETAGALGLATSGTKAELVARITDWLEDEIVPDEPVEVGDSGSEVDPVALVDEQTADAPQPGDVDSGQFDAPDPVIAHED